MERLKLFHMAIPGRLHARTFRCLWLLEELGVEDFEVCMITPGVPYAPQMRERGMQVATKLPAVLIDGKEIGESGVICQLIAERFRNLKDLLGTKDERVDLLQWIGFAETCVMFRVPLIPLLMKADSDLKTIRDDVIEPYWRVLEGNVQRFEAHFEEKGTEFLLGSGFSVADAMCGWSLFTFHNWRLMDLATGHSPLTLTYLERLRSRPAFQRTEKYAELDPGFYSRTELNLG